jgi:outer membrane lipoprotein SlyB
MKARFFAIALVSSLAIFSQAASAKGCLKGAAVGGAAGHVVGGHGVAGAAAGCVVGRHRANKKTKQEAAQASAAQAPSQPATSR